VIIARAQEIIDSPENIEVLHNGNQVWIENVNTSNGTAQVRVLDNSENIVVPVNELDETGRELK
jgi:H-type small acid-soluble spore protein